MSRYCTECGAAANDLGPFCATCGGRVRTRGGGPATAVALRRERTAERVATPPAPRTWDQEFEAVEQPIARAARRPPPVRPALVSEVPLALAAVALASVLLGFAAWLVVLRPSDDSPQTTVRTAAPTAAKHSARRPRVKGPTAQPAAPSTPTTLPPEGEGH
jgi:hypothetical protein